MSLRFKVISNSATYQLTRNVAGVDEGSTFQITLNTTGVQNGQMIPYVITGIQQNDIAEPLSGYFVVQNGASTKTFTVYADVTTEGTEIFTLTLSDVTNKNVSVTINDTSTEPSGDPYFNNVALLMHMDGATGSTSFLDVKGHTFSKTGNVQIANSQSMFGGASAYFDGDGDYITTPNSADFNLNAATQFTIEGWFNPSSIKTENAVLWVGDPGVRVQYYFVVGRTGGEIFFGSGNGNWSGGAWAEFAFSSGANITPGQWVHVAVVRNGTALTIYRNGVSVFYKAAFNFGVGATSGTVCVGNYAVGAGGSALNYHGYIDELRITKGVARYTSNFTPAGPFLDN